MPASSGIGGIDGIFEKRTCIVVSIKRLVDTLPQTPIRAFEIRDLGFQT
jgi:hypothetical protein